MSSTASSWELRIKKPAEKHVLRAPRPERERLARALDEMRRDPFTGDVRPLKDQPTAWRRRVGDWRILFDVYPNQRLVVVAAIVRRTSTTY